jgi:hypothetical protein
MLLIRVLHENDYGVRREHDTRNLAETNRRVEKPERVVRGLTPG